MLSVSEVSLLLALQFLISVPHVVHKGTACIAFFNLCISFTIDWTNICQVKLTQHFFHWNHSVHLIASCICWVTWTRERSVKLTTVEDYFFRHPPSSLHSWFNFFSGCCLGLLLTISPLLSFASFNSLRFLFKEHSYYHY